MLLTYSVEVNQAIGEVKLEEFAAAVARVLDDRRGWRKYGYEFVKIPADRKADVRIRLETAESAKALCGMAGFSCQRGGPKDIIINLDNWLGKSASELPVERYHNYVLMHELGHHLGLDHQRCPIDECRRRGMKECPASVMQQMTRGRSAIAPCIESDWPLDPDWLIDDPRPKKGRTNVVKGAIIIVLIIIVILIASLTAVLSERYTPASQATAPHLPIPAAAPLPL